MRNFINKILIKNENCQGFTLIELLVVIAILGVLSTIGLGTFRSSQAKSRDSRRKSDLANIQRALEMYLNDYGVYPSSTNGEITLSNGVLSWDGQSEFIDEKGTVYMKELPDDPAVNQNYCYTADSFGRSFQLYAKLENIQDINCLDNDQDGICDSRTCAGVSGYNFGVSSANAKP